MISPISDPPRPFLRALRPAKRHWIHANHNGIPCNSELSWHAKSHWMRSTTSRRLPVANKVTRICSLAWSKKTCLNLMKSDCVFAEFCNVFPVWVLLYILYILGLSFLNLALYVPFSCCRPRNVTVPICTYAKVGVVVAAKPFVETFHLLSMGSPFISGD